MPGGSPTAGEGDTKAMTTTTPAAPRLASPANAARPGAPARTRLYRDGVLALEGFPVEDISEYLAEAGTVVWLDLCAPTAADFTMINAKFGLHELAVEDALTSAPSSTATPSTCSSAPTPSTWTPEPASWRRPRSPCSSPAGR
jgi:hypothetical protein